MPRYHLIRCLIATLLTCLFLSVGRAEDDRAHQRVPVNVAWDPSPTEDADGNPLAPAVQYVVWASREGTAPVAVATVEEDTTCILKFYPGSTYRVRVVGYDAQGRPSDPSEWSDPIFPNPPTSPGLLPAAAKLPPNWPNPFNPATTIAYAVPTGLEAGDPVSLAVFDVRGHLVRRFTVDRTPGEHQVMWHGTDERGAAVASGIYVTRLVCGDDVVTRRMTMLK